MIRVGSLLRLGFGDNWGGCDVEQDPIEAFAWGTLDIVGYPNRIFQLLRLLLLRQTQSLYCKRIVDY